MLQIRTADDGKSEWNASEAHIIIPMIDGDLISNKDSEKILTSTIGLNSLEGGDQTMLPNGLEHNLVVGLDKNLFETTNYKSDLLIIQNSDLKVLPCNSDLKVAYTLSNIDHDKSEILWQNSCLKDRICTNDKAVFEVRQVLNYDDVDLEKTNEQINLESMSNDMTSQVTKPEKEVLMDETICKEKGSEPQFIVNYNPEVDNPKSICISLNAEVSKTIENMKFIENKKLYQTDIPTDLNAVDPSYRLSDDFEETVYDATNKVVPYSDSPTFSAIECDKNKSDIKEKSMTRKNETANYCKESGGDKWSDDVGDFFPEKNLPLKKKAKMKRTLMAENSDNQRSLLKQDLTVAQQCLEFSTRKKMKQVHGNEHEKQNLTNTESQLVKINIRKQNKIMIKASHKNSLVKEVRKESKKTDSSAGDDMTVAKLKSSNSDETKFSDIFHLVDYLQKCQIINGSIRQILNSGLKEIKVDILKEMNTKRKENCSFESCNYSPQLKAFALVLYFKQPAAFNYLSQIYKNGWPNLNIIKEWKRRMNTIHRRNFIRDQSETENNSS